MKCKVSSSVGNFEEKVLKAWGLEKWQGIEDPDKDILFFGLYHDFDWNMYHHLSPDYKRTIFWCGSDVTRLLKNPDRQRILKLFPVTHYCETEEEAINLRSVGIEPIIKPSFVEDVNDFPLSYKHSDRPQIWLCTHPGREEEYGVDVMERMAKRFPTYTFHIYGDTIQNRDKIDNVIFHGVVPNEQFNEEIKEYQCGLRCNKHEGFSEVPIKSLLMGQYPITWMEFPHIWNWQTEDGLVKLLTKLKYMKEPNLEAREYWLKNLNQYPWMPKA